MRLLTASAVMAAFCSAVIALSPLAAEPLPGEADHDAIAEDYDPEAGAEAGGEAEGRYDAQAEIEAEAAAAAEGPDPADVERPSPAPEAGSQDAAPAPPVEPTLTIAIDLTEQRLSVSEYGKQRYSWSISSGAYGYPTPTGTFRPEWMAKMWHSRKYDLAPMPHAIFFVDGTAIHGTYSTSMLGTPASHGCVRLAPKNAATLYAMVAQHGKERTEIEVFGTPDYSTSKIARDDRPRPRYTYRSSPYGYMGYGGYRTGPRYVYRDYEPGYYAPSRKRRAAWLRKGRRAIVREYYYSGYGYDPGYGYGYRYGYGY